MKIVSQLKEKVFNDSSFLRKLVENHNYLKDHFQLFADSGYKYQFLQARLGENYESIFLSVLSEEIHQKLPKNRVLLSVDMIIEDQPQMSEANFFNMQLDDIRKIICNPNNPDLPKEKDICFREIQEGEKLPSFHHTKCFEGRKWETEIDAVISNDSDELCFIEYEEKFGALCNNFMKMHRLKRSASDRQVSSLFVTRLSDRKDKSTLNKFNNYMTKASPLLDTMLEKNWSALVIVNLLTGKPRLKWYPELSLG